MTHLHQTHVHLSLSRESIYVVTIAFYDTLEQDTCAYIINQSKKFEQLNTSANSHLLYVGGDYQNPSAHRCNVWELCECNSSYSFFLLL